MHALTVIIIMLTDPDAPTPENPKKREWRHWLVMNIPGNDISSGETCVSYIGAAPPKGSNPHRYVILGTLWCLFDIANYILFICLYTYFILLLQCSSKKVMWLTQAQRLEPPPQPEGQTLESGISFTSTTLAILLLEISISHSGTVMFLKFIKPSKANNFSRSNPSQMFLLRMRNTAASSHDKKWVVRIFCYAYRENGEIHRARGCSWRPLSCPGFSCRGCMALWRQGRAGQRTDSNTGMQTARSKVTNYLIYFFYTDSGSPYCNLGSWSWYFLHHNYDRSVAVITVACMLSEC